MNKNEAEIISDELRCTAIHEAGHALAHIRNGIWQEYATIKPLDSTMGGVLAEKYSWSNDEAGRQAIAFCAGYGACIAAGYDEESAMAGCRSDFEAASSLCQFWSIGSFAQCRSKAVKLMRAPKNIRAVDMLAAHLLKHTTLEHEYMQNLVWLADGKKTQASWEQYLKSRGPMDMDDFVKQHQKS